MVAKGVAGERTFSLNGCCAAVWAGDANIINNFQAAATPLRGTN